MPSEINGFTKNMTVYPRNKTCKSEIEFQISLYVLIIQEKQKKIVCAPSYFDIEMLVFSLMDTAKINKDTPKTPFESMQPTTMPSSNTIRCSYCVISFFFFLFHNWMSVLILDKGLWENTKKRSDVVKKKPTLICLAFCLCA